ncbi:MAG: FtsX-like permease family protein [Anaerolineae bacterium]
MRLVFDIAAVVAKRLWGRLALTLLSLFGVVLAISLAVNISIFSDGVGQAILLEQLAEITAAAERPPFALQIYAFPSPSLPVSWDKAKELGGRFADIVASELDLPVARLLLRVESRKLELRAGLENTRYGAPDAMLETVRAVVRPDIGERMDIVAGEPLEGGTPTDDPAVDISVWMHADLAEEIGVQVGDGFDLVVPNTPPDEEGIRIPVRVAGIWRARDAHATLWFRPPGDSYGAEALFVRSSDYVTRIEPHSASGVGWVSWHIVLDERAVDAQRTAEYLLGLKQTTTIIDRILPGARMASPLLALKKFSQRENLLLTLLISFSVPSWAFLFYFLVLISIILAYWQQTEIAVMDSRGMNRSMLFLITLGEGLLLCAVGLPLGIAGGVALARLMGYARGFLTFLPGPPLPVSLGGVNVVFIAVAIGVFLMARLIPTLLAARRVSIVTHEQRRFRALDRPFWLRYYLDLFLAVPVAYGYWRLTQLETLNQVVQDSPTDLYQDPLLILVPALLILEAALLSMRVFPLVMHIASWVSRLSPWVSIHFGFRQLSRLGTHYLNPLFLVVVTLSLGVYMASMAASLDQWMVDRIYYRTGADVSFRPYGTELSVQLLPMETYRGVTGVEEVTWVGEYPFDTSALSTGVGGRFLAVERLTFPQVAAFRPDFAPVSLGELMNRLAVQPDGILVSQSFLDSMVMDVGDQVNLSVGIGEFKVSGPFTIVGRYDYFPTVYEDQTVVVGNLEYLFTRIGGPITHYVWLETNSNWDTRQFRSTLDDWGVFPFDFVNAKERIAEERSAWERVGVFGTLSVGFLAGTGMAVTGLLVYDHASLQERVYHFAILRAVGMEQRQLMGQVAIEYSVLTLYSALLGTLIGLLTSRLFIPFFRFTGEQSVPRPPLVPIIAWSEVAPLALGFTAAMILVQIGVVLFAVARGVLRVLRMGQ